MEYSIPDRRELTTTEIQFLSYLFKTGKPEWSNFSEKLKIIARCGCGKCPTILFGETLDSEIQNGELILDFFGKDSNGKPVGVTLFGTIHMPTELEFYSLDGESEIIEIPEINTLQPVC